MCARIGSAIEDVRERTECKIIDSLPCTLNVNLIRRSIYECLLIMLYGEVFVLRL
jgi:hypothetical protein